MREIKFRAWDKEKKVLMPVKLMDFSEWWVSCNPIGVDEPLAFGERNSFKNEETDRHILMQYTGLKDKNGTEIYEGDIYHMGDPNITYTVVWCDSGLKGKQNGSSSYAGLESWKDKIEVIGNAHKDLLT